MKGSKVNFCIPLSHACHLLSSCYYVDSFTANKVGEESNSPHKNEKLSLSPSFSTEVSHIYLLDRINFFLHNKVLTLMHFYLEFPTRIYFRDICGQQKISSFQDCIWTKPGWDGLCKVFSGCVSLWFVGKEVQRLACN
jgi:hypothetical protein